MKWTQKKMKEDDSNRKVIDLVDVFSKKKETNSNINEEFYKDMQEQVFFPMVSSKEDGSGLGLSISQDIIRIHGGAISFNTASKGTTFSILIPINFESKNEGIKSA